MKKFARFTILILVAVALNAVAKLPINPSMAPMLHKVMPAVVNISVRGRLNINLPFRIPGAPTQPGGNGTKLRPKFAGLGSGIIFNAARGYVLTNYHVVKNAKIIVVTLYDGRRLRGKLLGSDAKSDIAVLKITAKHLQALKLGDSSKLNVGDYVAAIGSPFGLRQTVTSGVISGLGRSHLGIEGYENFIQTDAPINPGNSGGALVNMTGELIGINTAIITPSSIGGNIGIGMAIPVNMCKKVINQIIHFGKVEHSILGVIVQNISPALADAMHLPSINGALVSDVNPGTPAANAGLQTKDVITKIDGHQIRDAYEVSTDVGLTRPGKTLVLTVRRNGKIIKLTAKTISLKAMKAAMEKAKRYLLTGLSLRNYNQLENNQQVHGVQIAGVGDFSVAYSCGLRPGDVILSAAGQLVENINDLKQIAAINPNSMLLKIKRGTAGNIFLVLER